MAWLLLQPAVGRTACRTAATRCLRASWPSATQSCRTRQDCDPPRSRTWRQKGQEAEVSGMSRNLNPVRNGWVAARVGWAWLMSCNFCSSKMLSVKNSLKSTKDPLWILSIIFPGMGGRAGEITSGAVVHAGIAPRVEGMGVDRRDASTACIPLYSLYHYTACTIIQLVPLYSLYHYTACTTILLVPLYSLYHYTACIPLCNYCHAHDYVVKKIDKSVCVVQIVSLQFEIECTV